MLGVRSRTYASRPSGNIQRIEANDPRCDNRRVAVLRFGWVVLLAIPSALVLGGCGDSSEGLIEPSVRQVDSVPDSAVVLETGKLDGAPYEFVVKRVHEISNAGTGPPHRLPQLMCFQIDWPELQDRARGGACLSTATPPHNNPALETSGFLPGRGPSEAGIFSGIAESPDIAQVKVVRIDRGGDRAEIASRLHLVDGAILDQVGAKYPAKAFIAPLDDATVRAASERKATVAAIAYDADGKPIDRSNAFPPLSCPKNPEVLPHQSGGGPQPLTKVERDRVQRATECGSVARLPDS
jgi:hypothetical protein